MALPDLMPQESGERYYDREKWTARHALVCDLHIAGKELGEIAEITNYSYVSVAQIIGDARSKKYIQNQRDSIAAATTDIYKKLELYAHEAVEELVREMRFGTKDDRIKQSASTAILDRLGYSPIRKEIHANVKNPLSDEAATRMERLLDESKEIRAKFVFGEEKPVSEESEDG